MNTEKQFYIISAERANEMDRENQWNTESLRHQLKRRSLPHKQVLGCYAGSHEVSFVVVTGDERAILELTNKHEQESVLHVDANRQASLIYCDDERRESLGKFRTVPASTVDPKTDAYTIDPLTGHTWVAS